MAPFSYQGVIPASKSLVNRALIVQSYFPNLKLEIDSQSEDVLHLQAALAKISGRTERYTNADLFCGDGGTTLRFLALRVSRIPGDYVLTGTDRLFARPQGELISLLKQLGVQAQLLSNSVRIQSKGWSQLGKDVVVSQSESSQFLSALFLNAWGLSRDFKVKVVGTRRSDDYLKMTIGLLQKMGMQIEQSADHFLILANQKSLFSEFALEPDLSSSFSVAAAAALCGQAHFLNFPFASLQPDLSFLKIFESLQIPLVRRPDSLFVNRALAMNGIEVNVGSCPDLFPVLAVLCSFATGTSLLFGAPQLKNKESDRIEKSFELLTKIGIKAEKLDDGIRIFGNPNLQPQGITNFDPDHDHRMAMAAGILKLKGFKIEIKNPQVVNKSFPNFWNTIGVQP